MNNIHPRHILAPIMLLIGIIAAIVALVTFFGAGNDADTAIKLSRATFYAIFSASAFLFAVCILLTAVIAALGEQTTAMQK